MRETSPSLSISDYSYELPGELIAQEPLEHREGSRMLIVDRESGALSDSKFIDLPKILRPGDVLVLNNTKVFPARLIGVTETGAKIEIFLVRKIKGDLWETLARPARRLKPGKTIRFSDDLSGEVTAKNDTGSVDVRFDSTRSLDEVVDEIGKTPLPPYIKREAAGEDTDRERYQTVFARARGAIAAPTAGLHFTPEILDRVRNRGVEIAEITLHVGYGTFEPVRVADLSKHSVLPESFEIGAQTAETLNRAKSERRRMVAVGTTTTRALESVMTKNGKFVATSGMADLTITPGYRFKAIDALLTNFHL
ncbi:MAG TPA: tRNA preQ1(34) S-adenosylmethionine ribosyltransferase-isomerase QueA, partial [Pyrinomonadaceae bacterium]|nr:tRNA preQ1(34) S-adenosylmethionine ribosyltransferase-isomerase QueA [Pyrinomonadaceae bacterium]